MSRNLWRVAHATAGRNVDRVAASVERSDLRARRLASSAVWAPCKPEDLSSGGGNRKKMPDSGRELGVATNVQHVLQTRQFCSGDLHYTVRTLRRQIDGCGYQH